MLRGEGGGRENFHRVNHSYYHIRRLVKGEVWEIARFLVAFW